MTLTAITLCARALVKIGATGISGFDDGTAEAEVAAALYEPTRDALLSSHDWSFATAQARLARLDQSPVADYAFVYQLPPDFLRALSAGHHRRSRGLEYQIVGNTLHTDADEVLLSYIFRPDESSFPPFFAQALTARLSAEFCLPLTESSARSELMQRLAENEFRRARLIDGQQDHQPGFEDFSIINARQGHNKNIGDNF